MTPWRRSIGGQLSAVADGLKVLIGKSSDGKRRYVERTVRRSRSEAQTALARLVVEAAEGRCAAPAPMTFGEVLDRWRAVKRMAVEPSTIRNYVWRTRVQPEDDGVVAALLGVVFALLQRPAQ